MMEMADSVLLKAGRRGARKAHNAPGRGFKTVGPLEEKAAGRRLAALRRRINRADARLVAILAQRCIVAREVAAEKRKLGRPVFDRTREKAVLSAAGAKARQLDLDPDIVRRIFREIIRLARSCEHEFLSDKRG